MDRVLYICEVCSNLAQLPSPSTLHVGMNTSGQFDSWSLVRVRLLLAVVRLHWRRAFGPRIVCLVDMSCVLHVLGFSFFQCVTLPPGSPLVYLLTMYDRSIAL